ncbi:MAG: hypothetical protein GY758_21915, partial [Fuerstiella sp.]|nr:hypothetical protein [Fuerstiella sp.]
VLDTWAYGARHITSNIPIRHPDDLDGFRLRMPGASVWQASGAALGASPMPISFAEVYLALQQGIADGQENPVPVIKAKGFHEVQTCLNLTGHIQSSIQILMNERVWQRLETDQQELLLKVVQNLGQEVYRGIVSDERRLIEEWRSEGTMQIVENVDVDAFRRRARKFFSSGYAFSDLYNRITADPVPDDAATNPSPVPDAEAAGQRSNQASMDVRTPGNTNELLTIPVAACFSSETAKGDSHHNGRTVSIASSGDKHP